MDILLPAIYQCRVIATLNATNGEEMLVIDTTPLPEGIKFEVIWFSHVRNLWLITWRQGREEYYIGQTLWRDKSAIAFGGGQLPLYSPPQQLSPGAIAVPGETSVWDQVDKSVGLYGLSIQDALALQDPANRTYLVFDTKKPSSALM